MEQNAKTQNIRSKPTPGREIEHDNIKAIIRGRVKTLYQVTKAGAKPTFLHPWRTVTKASRAPIDATLHERYNNLIERRWALGCNIRTVLSSTKRQVFESMNRVVLGMRRKLQIVAIVKEHRHFLPTRKIHQWWTSLDLRFSSILFHCQPYFAFHTIPGSALVSILYACW